MNKLLAVLISSAVLVTAGQAFAQPAGDTSSSGSSMSKDQSMSDDGMSKKSKKHKRVHKKSKKSAEEKGMSNDTDNMNKK